MRIVVQKYGGSSLSTVDKLKEVAAKVVATRREGFGVVVVVSAMGNSTDELLTLARQVSPSPPKRELDMLLSVGERISMSLMSAAISDLGEEAISFTGSQCGIVTTDSHSNARIIDVRPFRVQDELARGRIVIVAGFQGTSYRREITTLGRGGSDTTAVALAAALGAEHCSIYSDVAGIYSADPRKVPSAQRLDEISYEEMQEFARLGARVMNAQAVEFARRRQISIWAKSTFGGNEGTQIHRVDGFPDAQLKEVRSAGVRGVASTSDTFQATVPDSMNAPALLEAIGTSELLAFRADSAGAHALVSGENVADADEFCRELADAGIKVTRVSTVSVVGLGVGTSAAAIARVRKALSDAEIDSLGLSAGGASVINVIPPGAEERAMNALHAEFLG